MVFRRMWRAAAALAGLAGLSIAGGSVAPLGAPVPARAADARPNVLLILTDDQRYEGPGGAAGFLNVMPNVKTYLHDQGEFFPNAFATTSLCCPSRGALMTGRYAHNTGVKINGDTSEQTVYNHQTTIQYRLRQAGYVTGIAGKYFNTWPRTMAPPYFDWYAVTHESYWDPQFDVNGTMRTIPGYTTTITGDLALQALQAFHTQSPGHPWYLEVAPQAPHDPYTADTPYAQTTFPAWAGNPATNEADRSDKPAVVRARAGTLAQGKPRRVAQLRTLKSVDDMVGRLMTTLRASGELQNTLVIFTSDNGMMWGEHGILDKRFPYEQSVKVPLMVRWPGHVTGGTTAAKLVALLDIAPTVLNATGTAYAPAMMDGHDLLGGYVRNRMHLEYWKSNDAPKTPSWRGTWTNTYEYVEWLDPTNPSKVTFREYYNLTKDPW